MDETKALTVCQPYALGSRDLLFDLDAKAIFAGVRKVGRVEVLDDPLESIH